MTPRYTWFWVTLALGLFAFIFFFERHWRQPEFVPPLVLPDLKPDTVTSVQVYPAGLRVERTNHAWLLSRPIHYPGAAASIESLLATLAALRAQTHVTAAELHRRTNVDIEFGFDPPQASLIIQQEGYLHQLRVGSRTTPGDQVFVQRVGGEGLYLVDANLLRLIPRTADDWRDPALVHLDPLAYDTVMVTNASASFTLQRSAGGRGWQLTHPMRGRADAEKVEAALQNLGFLRVAQFVTDDPKADAEAFGLTPPALSLTFAQGTNPTLQLVFGRSPTNNAGLEFARRTDNSSIVTTAREPLAPWRVNYREFRDRHLLNLHGEVERVEVLGEEPFTLLRQTSNTWRILPADLPADAELAEGFVAALSRLQVTQFVKDVVTPLELTNYGLATPARRFVLKVAPGNAGGTNDEELAFGATLEDKTYARRLDENSVYAVPAAEFQSLPTAAFQLRDRSIWRLNEDQIKAVTLRQHGKTRQLVRRDVDSWSLAPGSQGVINDLAVAEAVRALASLSAVAWVARGEPSLARHGFAADGLHVTLELKSGDQLSVRFGGMSPTQLIYAATTLAGQVWIFECPPAIGELSAAYLTIPTNAP